MDGGIDGLPDGVGQLQDMPREAKPQPRQVQLEPDIREATPEIMKKGLGTDPNRLTNREKAELVDRLRAKWRLKGLLPAVGMAKSSYEHARAARLGGEAAERAAAREAVVSAFEGSGGAYGYRRIWKQVNAGSGARIGERTVRAIVAEGGLAARTPKRGRRYGSHEGEMSEASPNLLMDEGGKHDFGAEAPNGVWITDVTEFRIPVGKVYLSPVLDCFDGLPLSWLPSTSPDAEMANSSLPGACSQLHGGESPIIHSDRGCHYRWPGWVATCEEHGLARSMSRKGRGPDSARCEGFFGRLQVEFLYGRDWRGVPVVEFMKMLGACLVWYRDLRLKSDLGHGSPTQYRRELGLAAWGRGIWKLPGCQGPCRRRAWTQTSSCASWPTVRTGTAPPSARPLRRMPSHILGTAAGSSSMRRSRSGSLLPRHHVQRSSGSSHGPWSVKPTRWSLGWMAAGQRIAAGRRHPVQVLHRSPIPEK